MLPFIKILFLSGLYAMSWSVQAPSAMPSKPDLQKVYNEALAWSKTKLEAMPTAAQSHSTSGIGVCKGGDAAEGNVGDREIKPKLPADLPLAPGCARKNQTAEGQPPSSQDKILVFVSFSMPKASLEALSHQAEEYNAVLVMRGLKEDSFKTTQHAFKDLGRETKSGIEINPEAFETYDIKQVPVFVLVTATDANKTEELARLSGNVSLPFAAQKLREVQKTA